VSASPPGHAHGLAFLVRDLNRSGAQRSQLRLAVALAARGFAVDLGLCSARRARLVPFLADPTGAVPPARSTLLHSTFARPGLSPGPGPLPAP
jgi:hypothetical protein